jgi:hypothetical protein
MAATTSSSSSSSSLSLLSSSEEKQEEGGTIMTYALTRGNSPPFWCFPEIKFDEKHTLDRKDWEVLKDVKVGRGLAKPIPCNSTCRFCERFEKVCTFYSRTVQLMMDDLHILTKEDDYDNMLQWLPTEMKDDVMELTKNTSGMGVSFSLYHT